MVPQMRRTPLFSLAAAAMLALTGCATMAVPPGAMTDPEKVAVVSAVNNGEIQTSEAVATRASTPAVQQFAQRMITDHTANQRQLEALGIPPQQNAISQQLTANAMQTVQVLNQTQPPALDRVYMQAQVALHGWTLQNLDNALIPTAGNRALRAHLRVTREAVAAHLQQAEQILQTLR